MSLIFWLLAFIGNTWAMVTCYNKAHCPECGRIRYFYAIVAGASFPLTILSAWHFIQEIRCIMQ